MVHLSRLKSSGCSTLAISNAAGCSRTYAVSDSRKNGSETSRSRRSRTVRDNTSTSRPSGNVGGNTLDTYSSRPADRRHALGDSLDGWTAGDGHQHLARQARRAHPPLDRGYDTETRLGGMEQRTAGVDDLEARSLERDPRRGVLSFHHGTQPEEPQRPEGVPGEAAEGSRPNTAAPPLRRDVNADGRVLVLDVEPHHAGVDAVYAHDE